MKFFDDSSKKTKWWNRNYFFAGTIVVIIINIILYAKCGNSWEGGTVKIDDMGHWGDVFYFNPTIMTFLNAFSHANWQHVLLNMLCFAIVGLYVERKIGTFGIVGFVVFSAYVCGVAVTANDLSVGWHGFSGVNYFLYAYVILDYVFSFRKSKRNLINTVLGASVIAVIYVAMCFCSGVSGFEFEFYPYDLMHNMGHYSAFLMGIAIGLFKNLLELITEHNLNSINNK